MVKIIKRIIEDVKFGILLTIVCTEQWGFKDGYLGLIKALWKRRH